MFVLDRSGSMAASIGESTLWDQLVLSTKTLIKSLNEDDKFDLVLFNHEIEVFNENYMYSYSKSNDKLRKDTDKFLKSPTRGLTFYTPALNEGFKFLNSHFK